MKYTTVSIPQPLNDRVKKLIKNTGFSSVSSFVAFVLRELLSEQGDRPVITSEEKIKERLRKLGYL